MSHKYIYLHDNSLIQILQQNGLTPIMNAAQRNNVNMVRMLLAKESEIDQHFILEYIGNNFINDGRKKILELSELLLIPKIENNSNSTFHTALLRSSSEINPSGSVSVLSYDDAVVSTYKKSTLEILIDVHERLIPAAEKLVINTNISMTMYATCELTEFNEKLNCFYDDVQCLQAALYSVKSEIYSQAVELNKCTIEIQALATETISASNELDKLINVICSVLLSFEAGFALLVRNFELIACKEILSKKIEFRQQHYALVHVPMNEINKLCVGMLVGFKMALDNYTAWKLLPK